LTKTPQDKIMKKIIVSIILLSVILSCKDQTKTNANHNNTRDTEQYNNKDNKKSFLSKIGFDNKVEHEYTVTINNPKFSVLQIPQPIEYVLEVKVNGKSSINKFQVKKNSVKVFNGFAYVILEASRSKQSGTFKGNASFEISTIKGYSGFTLWIDGNKVKEVSAGVLKYDFKEK